MELRRNAEFLRALGHKKFKARVPLYQPKADLRLDFQVPYYVLFPGGSWANKLWPVENFGAVATLVHQNTGWRCVVCGGVGDRHFGQRLREATDAPMEDMIGRTTLDELAALVAGASFLLGNDTSAVHLAAAVSTPAVCILGGGHFGRFFPYQPEEHFDDRPLPVTVHHEMHCYGCNWNCIHKIEGEEPFPCIADISVEAVVNSTKTLLTMKTL
jgi:ADP-heptose:LPS heptosyltransferase